MVSTDPTTRRRFASVLGVRAPGQHGDPVGGADGGRAEGGSALTHRGPSRADREGPRAGPGGAARRVYFAVTAFDAVPPRLLRTVMFTGLRPTVNWPLAPDSVPISVSVPVSIPSGRAGAGAGGVHPELVLGGVVLDPAERHRVRVAATRP